MNILDHTESYRNYGGYGFWCGRKCAERKAAKGIPPKYFMKWLMSKKKRKTIPVQTDDNTIEWVTIEEDAVEAPMPEDILIAPDPWAQDIDPNTVTLKWDKDAIEAMEKEAAKGGIGAWIDQNPMLTLGVAAALAFTLGAGVMKKATKS